jgi:predicted nucleic acid-binding protein
MVYLDTSAAVPLFVSEPSSDLVDRWLDGSEERVFRS